MKIYKLIFIFLIYSWHCHAEPRSKPTPPDTLHSCQINAWILLERISPTERGQFWSPPLHSLSETLTAPQSISAIKEVTHRITNVVNKNLDISFLNYAEFLSHAQATQNNGVWLIYSSRGPNTRVSTGHLMVLVRGQIFSRNIDNGLEPGPIRKILPINSILTGEIPITDGLNPWLPIEHQTPFVIAQLLEFHPSSVDIIEKYFNDRVAHFSPQNSAYLTTYQPLPLSHHSEIPGAENCVTFAFSFAKKRWQRTRPELETIHQELGQVPINEIPSRQIFNNPGLSSYRGTFWISGDPQKSVAELTRNDGYYTSDLAPLFLIKPLKPLQ